MSPVESECATSYGSVIVSPLTSACGSNRGASSWSGAAFWVETSRCDSPVPFVSASAGPPFVSESCTSVGETTWTKYAPGVGSLTALSPPMLVPPPLS